MHLVDYLEHLVEWNLLFGNQLLNTVLTCLCAGAIDSYLAEWMAYEENPYFRRPPSQNPPFPEGIAASQTFPQRTIEDATRGLSLGQEGIGSNQGQFSLERAQYETGPVNIGVDQPSMPETLFSFPIEDISDDTPRPGQESGMPLASTSQGPSPGYLEPMSFEEERPGLQRYGLRSRGVRLSKLFPFEPISCKSCKSTS